MYMRAGSAGELGRRHGLEQIGFWRKILDAPQLRRLLAATRPWTKSSPPQPLKVPIMLVHSLWDQEDIYGAIAVYKAIKPKDTAATRSSSSWARGITARRSKTAAPLGAIKFDSDTGTLLPPEHPRAHSSPNT